MGKNKASDAILTKSYHVRQYKKTPEMKFEQPGRAQKSHALLNDPFFGLSGLSKASCQVHGGGRGT